MKIITFFQRHKNNLRAAVFFLVTSALIVFLLPKQGRFKYDFQKGRPWMHENLQAPFDFPIYKTELEIAKEKDSLLKGFKPYFLYDAEILTSTLNKFNTTFDQRWKEYTIQAFKLNSENYDDSLRYQTYKKSGIQYKDYLASLLKRVYQKGIIDLTSIGTSQQNEYNEIVIVKGNIAETVPVEEVFAPRSAYDFIVENLWNEIKSDKSYYIKRYQQFFEEKLELTDVIEVNLFYDESTSLNVRNSIIDEISLFKGKVQRGQTVITKGEIISAETYRILESLKIEYEARIGNIFSYLVILGKIVIVLILMFVVYLFLFNLRKEILSSTLATLFILLLIISIVFTASIVSRFGAVNFYIIPFVILPIIIRTFYDERLAIFLHIIVILLIGFFAPNSYEFIYLNILAGIVAVFSLTNLYRRSKFFIATVYVVLTYCFAYLGLSVIEEGNLSNITWNNFLWFGLNGALLFMSSLFIFIFEKAFGFLSDTTLMELSDTNQSLLRKLAETAPGTFQHSLQVANLAEEAAYKVGANPLLIRTGALYHDIGKMKEPIYFIENQTSGYNPHDMLEFEESAKKIINHVSEGVDRARKVKLPEPLVDFIRTHHGTTTVQYFYKSYIKKYPQEEVDIKKFMYPGPKPFSKEMAILMMADAVEAASRSLENYTTDTINSLVERIINYQLKEDQYTEADITFKDITTIKEVFKNRLRNIYHARISYPT